MNLLKYKIELQVQEAVRAASQFMAALRVGLSIDIGRRLVDGFLSIKRGIQGAITEGIRFNATVESSVIGIAAILRQFSSDKYKTFGEAMRGAANAVEYLKQRAKETPATFENLVMSFQALSGPMSAAGIEIRKQIDLVVLMSQALSGLGIREQQLIQESRALVTGMINQNAAAAKILGITKEQIDAARQSGQLYEFLTGRLSAFNEAAERGATSLATSAANLKDSMQQAFGAATTGLFEQLKGVIEKLNTAISSDDARTGLQMIASLVGSAIGALANLAGVVARNAALFAGLATVLATVAAAHVGLKLGQLVAGMGLSIAAVGRSIAAHLTRTTALRSETAAVAAHTAAVRANTVALQGNQAAGLKPVTSLNRRNFGVGQMGVLTGRSATSMAGQMTTVEDTAASANRAAASGSAIAATAGRAASVFGEVLSKLSVWGIVAYSIGKGIASAIDSWSRAKQDSVIDKGNTSMSGIRELGGRVRGVSSEEERRTLVDQAYAGLDSSQRRRDELSGKLFKTDFDRAEMQNLDSDIATYDKIIKTLNSLTREQIEEQRKRNAAEREAKKAADERAQQDQNVRDNDELLFDTEDRIGRKKEEYRFQSRFDAIADPQKRMSFLREELDRVNKELRDPKNDLGQQRRELTPELFSKKARHVEGLNERSIHLQQMLDDEAGAQKKARDDEDKALSHAKKSNDRRAFDRRWDQAPDDQKSAWLQKQMAAGKAAMAAESDPLKREQLRGKLLDLADKEDDLKKTQKSRSDSLAKKTQKARDELAEMGLSKSVGDIGISERFDWMGAVAGGKSPDEEIAANTQRMKELLEQIAKSEGIT